MTRTRNADEFERRVRHLNADYQGYYKDKIARLRASLEDDSKVPSSTVDEALEVHSREYIVNGLFAALNWRLDKSVDDGLPNLATEASVRSAAHGTSRRMDYFGYEATSCEPLLVVETKRLRDPLPVMAHGTPATTHPEVIVRGLAGESLTGEWDKWLEDVRDYVLSVSKRQRCPRRVVITNGGWLVVFTDPRAAFVGTGRPAESSIHVFESLDDVARPERGLFGLLEHSRVSREPACLRLAEIGFFVDPDRVDQLARGLLVRHAAVKGIYEPSGPIIKVAPCCFLRSKAGTWTAVAEGTTDYEVPHDLERMSAHLDTVRAASDKLCRQLDAWLGRHIDPTPIETLYEHDVESGALQGVRDQPDGTFLLVTGAASHLLIEPTERWRGCQWHSFGNAVRARVAGDLKPVFRRSSEPLSFFVDGEPFHCAHSAVRIGKSAPVDASNSAACGPRSRRDGNAFCEIFRIEARLCCRTCGYSQVCSAAPAFQLPCG